MNKYQEALNFFKKLPYNIPLKFADDNFCEKYDSNFSYIKELVDKATPTRPNYEGDGYDDKGNLVYDTWVCPNCNKRYEVDYEKYEYCPNCGQAILWGDEE